MQLAPYTAASPAAAPRRQSAEPTKYPGVVRIHVRGCGWQSSRCRCGKRVRYQAAVWSPKDNKRIRKHFENATAANDWRNESKGAIRKRIMRAPSATTVAEAAEKLIADLRSGDALDRSGKSYKPSAVRAYETSLRLRITPHIGHVKLSALDREEHVQPLVDEWRKEGIKPSTVRNQLNPLQVICRRAIKAHVLAVNPTTGIDLPMGKGRRTRVADPTEAAKLIGTLQPPERAIWATATYAGLRLGEIRALRVSDVDFDEGTIHVRRSCDSNAKVGIIDVKSNAGKRDVPLLSSLRSILEAQLRETGRIGDALMFGRTATEPFTTSNVYRRARKVWAAENERRVAEADDPESVVKLSPINLHECRHTFGTWGLNGGWNLKQVSVYMGHANIKTTADVYVHLLDGDAKLAAGLLDDFVEGRQATVTSLSEARS